MMPFQTYQLYQIERPKSAFEIRSADERAGRAAAALTGMLRRLRPQDRGMDCTFAAVHGRMTTTMEAR
jgi:hypothetical protein